MNTPPDPAKPEVHRLVLCDADATVMQQVCRPITDPRDPALRRIIDGMFAKCIEVESQALTALQIGLPICVFVMHIRPTSLFPNVQECKPLLVINPEIIGKSSENLLDWETCPSTPNTFGLLWRATSVQATFVEPSGSLESRTFRGFEARIFQHACDHLQGKMFQPEREFTRERYMEELQKNLPK